MNVAKDVMSTKITTVQMDAEISHLARLFVDTGFGTLPVVDAQGQLCGIVSESDVLKQQEPVKIPRVTALFDWVFYLESEEKFQQEVQRVTATKVSEIMTKEVITCVPETPVGKIANLMTQNRIHLVPVVEEDALVGVVARVDLLKALGA